MDIQHLVDRLEDLIDEGRHIFGTKLTMIDEERALEIIDQMRISIPEEIEKSSRVLAARDRVLAEANEEAARIIQQSRQRGDEMIDKEHMVQAAQVRAQHIIEQANQEASKITAEADAYVLHVLSQLEQQIIRNLGEVRNGITHLQHRPQTPQPTSAPTEEQAVVEVPSELETVEVPIHPDSQS